MDVLIIGAGAAGLAAGSELARAGHSVLLLEARDRIGGRCWTRHEPADPMPVEYGAEFVHGRPHATFALLRRYRIAASERAGTRWFVKLGRLHPAERSQLFDEIRRAMQAAGKPRIDLSFADYLERRLAKRLSEDAQIMARRMVEGYDAADPQRVSARAIVEEWSGDSTGADLNYRPAGGYGVLLGALAGDLDRHGARLRRQCVVQTVRWKRGRVEVEGAFLGRPFQAQAERCIVTLPLGVLQHSAAVPGAVQFTPTLDRKHEALAALASGAALKVILRFRRPFWEEMEGGRYRQAGFFQAPQAQFPTFWTALPHRMPMLVAWAGGPRARRMSGAPVAEIVHCAVESAQLLFGTACEVASELAGAYVHDWQSDPHAAGAYSYVQVGGEGARKALAAPLADTLFFAGEATDYEGETGTVAGALQSGLRAAREVLASARKTSRTHGTRGKAGDRREPSAAKRSPPGRVV